MISFGSHVWAIADRSVSAIHSCALYAGMRIDTRGCMIHPSQQPFVYFPCYVGDHVPGMPFRRVTADVLPVLAQASVEVAREVAFDGPREVDRVFRAEYKPRLALDDGILQGTHVGGDNRQAETVRQKQDTALVDVSIGQHQ